MGRIQRLGMDTMPIAEARVGFDWSLGQLRVYSLDEAPLKLISPTLAWRFMSNWAKLERFPGELL